MDMNNPWTDLPDSAPFVLPQDAPLLERYIHLKDPYRVQTEVLPAPFLGSLDAAKVVLLNLNPGYSDGPDGDIHLFQTNKHYVAENRKSLAFESDPPFYCLSERFSTTDGFRWWQPRLRHVVK